MRPGRRGGAGGPVNDGHGGTMGRRLRGSLEFGTSRKRHGPRPLGPRTRAEQTRRRHGMLPARKITGHFEPRPMMGRRASCPRDSWFSTRSEGGADACPVPRSLRDVVTAPRERAARGTRQPDASRLGELCPTIDAGTARAGCAGCAGCAMAWSESGADRAAVVRGAVVSDERVPTRCDAGQAMRASCGTSSENRAHRGNESRRAATNRRPISPCFDRTSNVGRDIGRDSQNGMKDPRRFVERTGRVRRL
jgi:hypothetical protein